MILIKIKDKLRQKSQGSALIYVLFVFVFVSLTMIILFNYFQQNHFQALRQEKSLQAHFIALSGAEIAVNALLQEPTVSTTFTKQLIEEFRDDPSKSRLTHTISLNNGRADITVDFMPAAEDTTSIWVQVVSVGSINMYSGETIKSTSRVEINASDLRMIRWY